MMTELLLALYPDVLLTGENPRLPSAGSRVASAIMSMMPNQPVRRVRTAFIVAAIIFGFGAAVPVGQGLALQAVFLVVAILLAVTGLRAPPSNPRDVLAQIAKERELKKFP